jgi:hypothetical protein
LGQDEFEEALYYQAEKQYRMSACIAPAELEQVALLLCQKEMLTFIGTDKTKVITCV